VTGPISIAHALPPPVARNLSRKHHRDVREKLVELLMVLAASFSVCVTAGIIFVLVSEALGFFRHVSVKEFLTDTEWMPLFAVPRHGILPLVSGTLMTTGVALLVALPVGTVVAIYLSEFAPHWLRESMKPLLELLNAVPTVVYGYFALLFIAPLLQTIIPNLPLFSMLSAGLVMGIMIVPYVSSLSEDALRSVPMILREGSYALGAGKLWTALRVVVPAALSGIGAWNPTEPAQTITAYIVQVSLGDLPHGGIGYQSIFAAGLTLFVLTLGFNLVGHFLRTRLRQAY
jgi:phosphate transport system permease protein